MPRSETEPWSVSIAAAWIAVAIVKKMYRRRCHPGRGILHSEKQRLAKEYGKGKMCTSDGVESERGNVSGHLEQPQL